MQIDDRRYIIYFIALIIIVTCVRLAVIGLSLLTPQEAYYWNYAQHPDWSYFDHPAAASMVINFGTSLFGENSFGVRFGGVMISTILAILTFIFVRKLFNARVGFYSTLLLNVIWIFAIGAVVTTPDSPLFLFWILSVILIYYASRKNRLWLYILWGISAGLGFASKYTMALLFPSALLFLLLTDLRSQLKTWINFAVGCMASIIAAFPVFYWNYLHDWASFAFQTSRRAGEMSSFRIDMFFGFLGSQLG
ncbi:MAG: glycosyltransferase family 39 protein, partial [candidate division Zixibacteria bacterium]|nr:glycosyltransferase family 39 protein [candidate division Zixibacteria bacterium]